MMKTCIEACLDGLDGDILSSMSADEVRGVLVDNYKRLERLGMVKHADLFAEALVVERDPDAADWFNIFLPEVLVAQHRFFEAPAEPQHH